MNKNEYYRNQISVNTEEVSKLYMRGVYEHTDLLHTSLLNYDRDKFVTYPTGKQKKRWFKLDDSLYPTCC